jgi:hypothetical protein
MLKPVAMLQVQVIELHLHLQLLFVPLLALLPELLQQQPVFQRDKQQQIYHGQQEVLQVVQQ